MTLTQQLDAGREGVAPVGFFAGIFAVYRLSLRAVLFSRRTVFTGMLALVPILMSALWWVGELAVKWEEMPRGYSTFSFMMVHIIIQFLVPLVALFYGTSLIADEIDNKTITYLLTRPIQRAVIPLGKYVSYIVCALVIVLPAVIISFSALTLGDGRRSFIKHLDDFGYDLLLVFLGVLAYGAAFTLIGIVFRKPLLVGFIYAIFWEGIIPMLPKISKLTITHYVQSLSPHISERMALIQLAGQVAEPLEAALRLCYITAGLLLLGGYLFSKKEYVLEQ